MAFPKIDGYIVTEKLGSGSYSTVYKAYTKVGARTVVAIKCVDKSRVKHSGSAIDNLITEIRLLKTLRHPHIVEMKNFTWDDKNIYIITEYCSGGDLSKYIHRYGRVPEKQVLYFLQQLVSALKFLRDKGVVHMDLKPHNLLLHKGSDNKYTLKVADFGFAQYMSSDTIQQSIRGSPLYMAPEMLTQNPKYDARVDLWSVGVILYECLFGRAPYSSNTFKELMEKIHNRAPIEIPRNSSISPSCRDLLSRLLQHDPNRRITYEELFTHHYLDLEHMPTKENYDTAVTLIRQAINLDIKGHPREALHAYCESLRLLVPHIGCETDPVRKAALTDKLNKYMERAEEIKKQLKILERCNSLDSDSQKSSVEQNVSSQDTEHILNEPANFVEELNEPDLPTSSAQNTSNHTQVADKNSKKFSDIKRRLFGKKTQSVNVPYLTRMDSGTHEENVSTKDNLLVAEPTNDGCRIT